MAKAVGRNVDVVVVGGGPTGLVITYMLLKAKLRVLTIEQYNKEDQALYGRACMLYARSVELLDIVGIYERIADIGYLIKDATTYKDGQTVASRGWTFVQKAVVGNTYFDFSFSIRQKHLEDAVRRAISEMDTTAVQASVKLLNYYVDQSAEYPVRTTISMGGETLEVSCKYLIGADGGRSTVRSLSKIPFPGTISQHRWVRMDAVVHTDMPSSRAGGVAIESTSHGNVLWTPTDNGRTRIGFLCPDSLWGENGEEMTLEAVMMEAKAAVRPFSLDFVHVDWWTVYQIGQRVAETFRDGPVFLAGDAAHTHSSGAAQGMNTGVHDATNLAWKLAGVLRGWFKEKILDTYTAERRTSALHLIQTDRDIASLISGRIPAHLDAPPDADVNEYLDKVFTTNASFTVGLGISYTENLINVSETKCLVRVHVPVGHRAPDVPLFRHGAKFPRRLLEFTAYDGHFWVLVFAGKLEQTTGSTRLGDISTERYRAFKQTLDAPGSIVHTLSPSFGFLTIVRGCGASQTAEMLGEQALGMVLYDHSGEAYDKYGIDAVEGAVVVLRPDGILALATSLADSDGLQAYFRGFVRPFDTTHLALRADAALPETMGEVSVD